jgi:hypothetical protein
MKKRWTRFAGIILIPFFSWAQNDSLVLKCPFEHGTGREPKEAFTWSPPDKKIIMISHVDSLIRCAYGGMVTTVGPTEDNNYEIVINFKDYYFWYYGVAKPLVKRGQTVKAGETIGLYKFGTELEFRMYKFEDMLDPRNLLECKVPKAE